jgi:UDP-glucose 4-epimerase
MRAAVDPPVVSERTGAEPGADGTETVLVTGGCGFLGAHLCAALAADGHAVVACDTDPDRDRLDRLGADGVAVVAGDVTDGDALVETARDRGVSRVVSLAAAFDGAVRADPPAATRVNAGGVANALELGRLPGVERVVLASSETVYAPDDAYDGRPTEDALLAPETPYAAAKRHAECLAGVYRESHGVSAVALRPTGVFGPRRDSFTEFAGLFERPAVGEPARVAGGETTVSWLDVRDAADAFRRAALAPAADLDRVVYNVRGEVATVAAAVAAVREAVPGADVTVTDGTDRRWSAQNLDLTAARADLGYRIDHDLAALVRETVESVRTGRGLDPR